MSATSFIREIKWKVLVFLGMLLPVAGAIGVIKIVSTGHRPAAFALWVYQSAEWLGPLAAIVLLVMVRLSERRPISEIRPITYVPPNGHWWEFVVFGAFAGLFMLAFWPTAITTLILIPLVLPAKAIVVYALGPQATLLSAFVAIPVSYCGVGILFAGAYFAAAAMGKGNISRSGTQLFPLVPGTGLAPGSIADVLLFSFAAMVGKDYGALVFTGQLRWLVLGQAAVAKAMEILIVTIGITLILNRY